MTTQGYREIKPEIRPVEAVNLIKPEIFELDNGVQAYAIDAGSEELLRIDLIFDAGSVFQDKNLTAFFAGKCVTEGTPSYTSREIAETVDFYGAYLKSMTTKDDSRISLYVLNRYLDHLLPLVKEVALQATFPHEEVETIVKKSRQEFLVNMQKVKYVARHHFGRLVFGDDHPYGRYATSEDYDNIDTGDLKSFFLNRYSNSAFKIIVAGKLPENLHGMLNAHFGKHEVAGKTAGDVHFPDPSPSETQEHRIDKPDALQSAFRIGRPLFNKLHPDFLKMQVLNTILGGYFGSRLMSNIREEKGYTYGIGSMLQSLKNGGMFVIASEVGNAVTRPAIDEVYKEIERLRTELVPDDELRLVKNYMLGSFLRSADGPFSLAELVKGVVDYELDMDFYQRYLNTIKYITAEEIRDLAVTYLKPDSLVRLIVGKNH